MRDDDSSAADRGSECNDLLGRLEAHACMHDELCQYQDDAEQAAFAADLRAAKAEIERLREALTELRDRIKDHPAYADLTEDEEIDTGGDTAELSYLARVADAALGA